MTIIHIPMSRITTEDDVIVVGRLVEGRPSTPTVEFTVALEKDTPATHTFEYPLLLHIVDGARPGALCAAFSCYMELDFRQTLSPFLVI